METMFTILEITDPLERRDWYNRAYTIARKLNLGKMFQQTYKDAQRAVVRQNRGHSTGRMTAFTDQPLRLASGEWICDDKGVRSEEMNRYSDDVRMEYASSIPILPTELITNEDTATERIRLSFYKDGCWRSLVCDRLTVASASRIVELANAGIEVTSENAKLLVRYIADIAALNMDVLPRRTAVSRLGWLRDEFVPYSDTVAFDGESENKALFDAVRCAGSTEAWVDFMRPLVAGNVLFRLTMAASLSSPIISRVNALPFVWHLWGGTGSGKTVALMCAMSVWGNPAPGALTRTMNMTANSMMATAAFLHSLPFAGDELQIIKDKFGSYDRLIMAVTEGVDRGRMTYAKNNPLKTWACSFLFTGEDPVTTSSSGGGVVNRVMEAECTGKLIPDGNAAVEFIRRNHGGIGERYIALLHQYAPHLQRMYSELFADMFRAAPDTTEKKAQTAALLATADYIASKEIFGIQPLTPADFVPFLKSSAEVSAAERAHDFVMDAIAVHAGRFLTAGLPYVPTGEIWGEQKSDGTTLINKTILVRILREQGFEFDSIKSHWAERGYLLCNSQGRYFHYTSVGGSKATFIKLVT